MNWIKRTFATAAILAIIAFFSQLSWGTAPGQALLRLSWRINGIEIRVPRAQDPNLPAHMRLPEGQSYDSQVRPYRCKVSMDGSSMMDQRFVSPGFHQDRPISVFQEFEIKPGKHSLEVQFSAEAVEGAPPPEPSAPYRATIDFRAGQVNLLTFDSTGQWQLK
jgi:hypothetical protein